MQPKLLLPPIFSHGLITVTVSWAFPILSSNLSRKFKTLLQDILMAPRHHHSTPLLKKLHWLPISERMKCKVACMCFRAINGSLLTSLHSDISALRLACFTLLLIPTCSKYNNTNPRLMAFTFSFPLVLTFGIQSHKTAGTAQLFHLLKQN